MATIGGLYRVHGERPDGVGERLIGNGHRQRASFLNRTGLNNTEQPASFAGESRSRLLCLVKPHASTAAGVKAASCRSNDRFCAAPSFAMREEWQASA
ncbi:hypothetical protein EBBID32_2070 [Sphingobium indicum BiD32]|uniref:Uncharacterized protein n=1 Tax=Sphingobium indicum BiD32 TaxID=1301087 RepID=N1MJP4_9SPHN|nr:hypothetical protein EBBID32_2070 [Sphingobium indicum BiD32]